MGGTKHIVWIVEDDFLYRESLEELVKSQSELELGLSVTSVEDAISSFKTFPPPDVILHDIGLPGKTGIEAIPYYKEAFSDVGIIMLTIFEDDERVFQAIKAGADGYLVKRTPGAKLVEGIKEVLEGGASMSPGIAKKVLHMLAKGGPKKETNLTPRETEILKLLVDGLTMDMISSKLGISSGTVDSHIKHIYKKLHVHNRAGVVSKAIKDRLV